MMNYVLLALVACLSPRLADAAIDVTASHAGDTIVVVANADVPVTLSEAWAVLNDYDHHAKFILDLKSSQVISQPGEPLRVAQTKVSRFGPFRFSVESTWEIETTPCDTVTARSVGGNIGEVEVVTRLHASGGVTRISYRVYSILKTLIPTRFLVGMVESDMVQRLQGLSDEMLRRKTLPSAALSTPVPPC
jgi:carbon monoxide dehydrogenase subunit G